MRAATSSPTPRVVAALARAEGREAIGHPVLIVGVVFVLIGSVPFLVSVFTRTGVSWGDDGWTVGVGFMLYGILTMVAANQAALRDRRQHTREQHATLPVPMPTRTSGLLAALIWPTAVAAALLAVVGGIATAGGVGLESAQAVAAAERVSGVLLLGAIGIAIAFWIPNVFVAPLLAWAFFLVHPGDPAQAWHSLWPFATLESTGLAMWHFAYVAGLTVAFALIALAGTSRLRSLVVPALAATAVIAASVAVLLVRTCPELRPCLL